MKHAELHLSEATKARSYLKSQVVVSKEAIKAAFSGVPPIGTSPTPCSLDITMHYSFDFAQQVYTYISHMNKHIDLLHYHRFTTLIILNSLDPSIFSRQGSVGYLEYVVRLYPGR